MGLEAFRGSGSSLGSKLKGSRSIGNVSLSSWHRELGKYTSFFFWGGGGGFLVRKKY